MATTEVRYQRIYDEPSLRDGTRVLVDRIWPRGVRKADAHVDEWMRAVAPSTHLRRWYGHEVDRFPEFRRRYLAELDASDDPSVAPALRKLGELARRGPLTLLTATRDVEHSQAAVLAGRLGAGRPQPPSD